MKILSSTFAIMLLFISCQTVFASSRPLHDVKSDPAHSLQTVLDRISAFHKNGYNHDAFALRHFIENEIMPRFSFETMAHWVARPYVRYMTVNDEMAFATRLRTDFFGMLIEHLGNFDPNRHPIKIDRTRFTRSDQATVAVRVYLNQQQPLALSFRMQRIHRLWKIVDIRSNGISLIMYYRTRYINRLRGYQHLAQ